jgi:ferric-dicitrate binding protein FerR (iron transport regulator)
MEDRVDPVHELLAEVASVQREQLRRADVLSDARARVVAMPARPARRVSRLWLAAPALAACGVVAVLALRPGQAPAPALTFRAGAGAASVTGAHGPLLAAPDDAELPLDFSDGSHVALAPGGRLEVEAVASRGATLALQRGRAEVHVVHRAQTSWVVKAGPARVEVTGTRFRVGWDPAAEELSVEMREGSVIVTGAPGVAGSQALRGGQTLRASRLRGRFEITEGATSPVEAPAPAAVEAPAPPARAASPAPRAAHVASRSAEPLLAPAPAAAPSPGWRALASGTRYAEALRAAEREGFERSCERLGAEDLVLLGDVARLAGDPDRAEQAYRAARRRFPAGDRAVFALGLTAFEQRRRYAEAAGWFDTYVRQYPGGPFAREAAGRLLEAWHRAGEGDRARRAASAYLARYPSGPHATLARQILAP